MIETEPVDTVPEREEVVVERDDALFDRGHIESDIQRFGCILSPG